jgi:hypothetical protein
LRRTLLHTGGAALGVLALVLLVRGVGTATFFHLVLASAPWLPLLLALEAARLGTEVAMTYTVTRGVRERVPTGDLWRIHFICYGVSLVLPAGRETAEATRAAMLSPYIGGANAAAVGYCNQSMAVLGGVLIAIPSIVAAIVLTGLSPIVATLGGFLLAASGTFAAIQLVARRREVGGLIGRYFAKAAPAALAFQDATRSLPVFPIGPTAAAFAGRVVQVLEYTVLLTALGRRHGVAESLIAQGVNLLGGALGDFIPGQVGATDSAFALAAPALGITMADGVTIAVLIHFVQLVWSLIGLSAPLWWRLRGRAPAEAAPSAS